MIVEIDQMVRELLRNGKLVCISSELVCKDGHLYV